MFVPLIAGLVLLVAFLAWEARTPEPMMPLELFAVRNFAVGNVTTLAMYGGLGVATFFLVVFLQQVAGYTPLEAGLALLPITLVMFALSRRAGALADRIGPRLFMSAGPALAGLGLLLLTRVTAHPDYVTTILPAVLVFALGLAGTVAPLTAAVLGSVEPGHSGLASGANNAVARVAGLLAIAAVGAVVSTSFAARLDQNVAHDPLTRQARAALSTARTRPLVTSASGVPAADRPRIHTALVDASVHAFRIGIGIAGLLAILGGIVALVGIENPRRRAPTAVETLPPARLPRTGSLAGALADPFVAIVTGASSGIGEATARRLAREPGARLVLVARRQERLDALAREIGGATVVAVDLTTPEAPAEVLAAVARAHGELHLLVNNAGASWRGGFAETGWENVERHMKLNFEAPVRLTEALLPLLQGDRENTGARQPPNKAPVAIVNVSSTSGRVGRPAPAPTPPASSRSPAGAIALRPRSSAHGVHVGLVLPGFIATEGFPATELRRHPVLRLIVSSPTRSPRRSSSADSAARPTLRAPRTTGSPRPARILAPGLVRRATSSGTFTHCDRRKTRSTKLQF